MKLINLLNLMPDRDLIALEGMMKQHQELKVKIDGRSKTIQQCADLGKILIAAGNPASEEVRLKATNSNCLWNKKKKIKTSQSPFEIFFAHIDKREIGQSTS